MKGYLYAALFSTAIAATAPAAAVSIDQHQIPAPAWKLDETQKTTLQITAPEPSATNHTDSLLQRQMRQLELLQEQAERDKARVEKLKQLKEES